MRKQSSSCFMILVCALGLQAAQHFDPSQGITLSNSYVRLEFEPGGMGLSALVDLHSGVNHIQPVKGETPALGNRAWQGHADQEGQQQLCAVQLRCGGEASRGRPARHDGMERPALVAWKTAC